MAAPGLGLSLGLCLCLSMSSRAMAQPVLHVTFPGPVEPGVTVSPHLTTVGSWGTPCEPGTYAIYWNGSVDWGDGVVTEWRSDSGDAWLAPHAYDVPGRYRVTVERSWRLLPYDEYGYPGSGEGDCVSITGHHQASTIVQVGNSNWTPVEGAVGVFVDAAAQICAQPAAPVTEMFVVGSVFTLDGDVPVGFGGAEFRLQSTGGLVLSTSAMPGWIRIGDPLVAGVSMARSCELATGSREAMLRITAYATTPGASGSVLVRRHTNPSNPHSTGLNVILCDGSTFTSLAATSWHAAFVGSESFETCAHVTTAVEPRSWTEVKGLYR